MTLVPLKLVRRTEVTLLLNQFLALAGLLPTETPKHFVVLIQIYAVYIIFIVQVMIAFFTDLVGDVSFFVVLLLSLNKDVLISAKAERRVTRLLCSYVEPGKIV